jgi:hypothetical protein
MLDIIQLAALSGTPLTQLTQRLKLQSSEPDIPDGIAELIQDLALQWQDWCLRRGLLTYSLIADLFWRCLLPHLYYFQQLPQRFSAVAADDIDLYPAIARPLFEQMLDLGLPGVFVYSELGGIREGLGADPDYLLGLRKRCQPIVLPNRPGGLAFESIGEVTLALSQLNPQTQPTFYTLQTVSRIQLLAAVAQYISAAIQSGSITPQQVAIIGPGLDPLARYALTEAFQRSGIAIESLHDQRPLQSVAVVRALLTLLALVYPKLGYLVAPDQVAEMLIVLSAQADATASPIDPVRAGLLADYCFRPHPEQPELLDIEAYPRWDRLGHQVALRYRTLRQWIIQQQSQLSVTADPGTPALYPTLNPVFVLDRAIQTFFMTKPLLIDQLTALRQLMETAQHYWDVDARLRKAALHRLTSHDALATFIEMLQRGTVTANASAAGGHGGRPTIVLANTFQYLNARLNHPWQFWLDAGSQLWQYSGAIALWSSSRFLHQEILSEDTPQSLEQRFQSTLLDLLGRAEERIYLCHSELTVNGQFQTGPLMPWIERALPVDVEV